MVCQDEIEFVRRAKYELERMMLVLQQTKVKIRTIMNCMPEFMTYPSDIITEIFI
jgi:hypothetical protein